MSYKTILAINAGSSSIKISLYTLERATQDPKLLAHAQISGVSTSSPTLEYSRGSYRAESQDVHGVQSHEDAFECILTKMENDKEISQLSNRSNITDVAHRVVHGGEYTEPRIIGPGTYHHLEELSKLAPLHNASSLAVIKSCHKLLPNATNAAFFDTCFHQTLSTATRTYLIDPDMARQDRLRKYGFHGISYAFIVRSVAGFLGQEESKLNIIALHLGSGASICAVKGGKSLDTSMGLTPLDGLPGATRSGSVDPSLPFHFSPQGNKEMHISDAEQVLNKQSGWKAVAGTTDFGEIVASDRPECKLVVDVLVDRILGYIGSYYLKLEGRVDAIVFAGGIGERSSQLRKMVIERCACIGFTISEKLNKEETTSVVQPISREGAKPATLVCCTDEQLEMARSSSKMREA